MAGRESGAQHSGASLGVGPTNSGGTPANKGLAAPAIANGFNTPLSNLPDWANMGVDPFKKSSVMARSPEKRVECSGRQPGTPQQEKKTADEEKGDMLRFIFFDIFFLQITVLKLTKIPARCSYFSQERTVTLSFVSSRTSVLCAAS